MGTDGESENMASGGVLEFCKEEGCARPRVGWGLCGLHYQRFRRSGQSAPTQRSQARAETVDADGSRKCWKCGDRKPFTSEHFPQDHRRPGQLKGTCTDCLRAAGRKCQLQRAYGLTVEVYEALLLAQGEKCAVCALPLATVSDGFGTKKTRPHIDHCHATGKVRGILCHHCNVMLGHAKDSTALLTAAITYLEASRAN